MNFTLQANVRSNDDNLRRDLDIDNERAWSQIVNINEISLRNHESLRQTFRRIAKNYGSLYEIGAYQKPLDTIATTMVKELYRLNLPHLRRNMYEALELDDYRKYRKEYDREVYELEPTDQELQQERGATVRNTHSSIPEESKLVFEELQEAYEVIKNADYSLLTRKQHQEAAELADKNEIFAEEQCKIRSIPLPGDKDDPWKRLDEMNPFRAITHLKKPERKQGALYEEMLKLKEDIGDLAEKIAEFGSLLPLDLEYKFAESTYALRMFIRPWNDDKWRRDWGGWAEILAYRKTTTKHGVESLSEMEGNKIIGYNEAGKPIKNYKGITCEQIDNKEPQAIKAFQYMYRHLPFFYYLVATYRAAKVPCFVDFTEELSPKLSHSS